MTRTFRGWGRVALASIVVLAGVTGGLARETFAQTPATSAPASDIALLHAGRKTTRSKIESRLSAPVRAALDRWSEPAERLELRIALGNGPEHVVLGAASDKQLIDAAEWMDQAFELLDPLVPLAGERVPTATVAVLMDPDSLASGAWDALLAELLAQRVIPAAAAEHLRGNAEGLTMRQTPLFLQPTWDIAGDAAQGDDEFRLGNEVVHKYAQCLLTARTGQQPPALMWGLGYVVEQKLFKTAYHFSVAGFVATGDHFDWSTGVREMLEERKQDQSFSLGAMAADERFAGQAQAPQMLTWAGLAFLSQRKPDELRALLAGLAAVQAEADPHSVAPSYSGDPARTKALLQETLDAIKLQELSGFLKKQS